MRQSPRSLTPRRAANPPVTRPKHVVTLLRKEKQDPFRATFQVPLRFNKFDLRDYLWNLYDLEVKGVRSWVIGSPVERRRPFLRAVYRPQAKKYMEVEMSRPFAWPEQPEDLEPWNKELWDAREKEQRLHEAEQERRSKAVLRLVSAQAPSPERQAIASMAEKLRSGELKWENGRVLDEKWDKELAKADAAAAAAPPAEVEADATPETTSPR